MSLSLSQNATAIVPGMVASFAGVGGTEPYVYTVLPGGAGGTINAATGTYTSPAQMGATPQTLFDTIQVTDAFAAVATSTIMVATPLFLFCEIIQKELGLANGRVYLWDQKIFQPTDNGLYIAVSVGSCKPFANVNRNNSDTSSQSVNMLSTLDIDIISRGPSARDRKEEVILALNSNYAQYQQDANAFYIAKLPPSARFLNLSNIDGAAIPYRFRISINIQYAVTKQTVVDYFDVFGVATEYNPTQDVIWAYTSDNVEADGPVLTFLDTSSSAFAYSLQKSKGPIKFTLGILNLNTADPESGATFGLTTVAPSGDPAWNVSGNSIVINIVPSGGYIDWYYNGSFFDSLFPVFSEGDVFGVESDGSLFYILQNDIIIGGGVAYDGVDPLFPMVGNTGAQSAGVLNSTAEVTILAVPPTEKNVIWSSLVGMTAIGPIVTSLYTQSYAWSDQETSGEISVKLSSALGSPDLVFGLSSLQSGGDYTTLNYGIQLQSGGAYYVLEMGVYVLTVSEPYSESDVFKVSKDIDGVVTYSKNDVVFYTSLISGTNITLFPYVSGVSVGVINSLAKVFIQPTAPPAIYPEITIDP